MSRDAKVETQTRPISAGPPIRPAHAPFRRRHLGQDLEHVTQEMYKRNFELAEANKTLSLLRTIDSLVLDSRESLQSVSTKIAQALTETTEYPFIGIFTISSHAQDELLLLGLSLKAEISARPLTLTKPLRLNLDQPWLAGLETSRLIKLDEHVLDELAPLMNYSVTEMRHLRRRLPLQSVYVVKLVARHRLVGVLVVGFQTPLTELTEASNLQLSRLSESIGVALDNKLLFEENQSVLRQLRISNAKLRALDEAKDDFISMASHQLRTPLTSIKGYLSLIIEGDTGHITPKQHEMLGQALFSSQRMVYLIADLLNISRLKTGKFVIDAAPVNLADVVREEMGQLKESGTSHSLTLHYEAPKDFPALMLDETKTRQVIMNFIDNAIYYTPAGGHITVQLLDKPSTIELRVVDDGIGVPKSEQHHLFTKFYRAGNARKARPDGTGLGLFMAKKVVVAQHGSIIFDSREDHGSTFGFIFNKARLAVPSTK